MNSVSISTEFIKLSQLLKLANLVGQGSDVKIWIEEQKIEVNGQLCLQRGKKVYPGDVVEIKNIGKIKVIKENE